MTNSADKPIDIRLEIEAICNKYGYFMGLAYEGEAGELKTYKQGTVVDKLEELITKTKISARMDELYRAPKSQYTADRITELLKS